MKVLSIVHHDNAAAGVFGDVVGESVEWCPAEGGPAPELDGIDAAMVFGGAMNADQEDALPWLRTEKDFLRAARPPPAGARRVSRQSAAGRSGGRPGAPGEEPEIGWRRVEITPEGRSDPLVGPLAPAFEVFQWHSYEAPLPPDAVALARSRVCLQAFRIDGLPAGDSSSTPRSRGATSVRGWTTGKAIPMPSRPARTPSSQG